jgi:hypothetical protein
MPQWKLASASPPVTLNVSAGDTGAVSGTLTSGPATYTVSGHWAASGSVPGRNASAFSVSGQSSAAAPVFVAAAGIMVGPGGSPRSVSIQLSESSSADGTVKETAAALTPS